MQTRSSSRLSRNQSSNPSASTNPNPKGRNRRRSKQRIKNPNVDDLSPPVVTMADQRTMAQLLQAPTEGYEDAIVVPAITADNFKLKHGPLTLVQNKQFFGHDKEDPHAHVCYFNKITSTLEFPSVPNTSFLRLKQPICVMKSPTFNNGLMSLSAKHGTDSKIFYEPVPIMVFQNYISLIRFIALISKDQDSLNFAVGVEESGVTCGGAHSYRNCPATDGNNYRDNIQEFVSQASAVNFNQGNTGYRPSMMSNQIRPPGFPPGNNFHQGPVYQPPVFQPLAYQAPAYQALAPQTQGVSKEDFLAYVKANDAVMRNMQTQGQNMHNQLTNLTDLITKFVNSNTASTSNSITLSSNTIANPGSDLKAITTRSGVSYDGPQISPPPSSLPPVVENEHEATKDIVDPTNNENAEDIQPQAVHAKPVTSPISEPTIAPVSASRPNPKASIPYPSRRNNERNCERAKDQIEKFYQIFKDMSFENSFADALMLMPKFASTLKALIRNKEKLSEMARTPLNEHFSTVLLKKLPEKLGDPGKFLIPCDFPGLAGCLALADLGASINLMPYSVWKRLSLSNLTPTCMTLELDDHSITSPVGIAEDVYVKVGSFHFPANFVVVDFDDDPRVPLIIGRSVLKIGRDLIDVFEGELTLRVGKEAITFNMDKTSRYSANYSDMTANRIDVIDMACEEYSQEVLGFSDTILSGNPTPFYDLIISATSPTLTPFENNDFLLEERGDILLLEAFLNDDPSLPPPPNQRNYLPEVRKELKFCEAHSKKLSVDEPPVAELKELPPHLEYAFLEGDNKLSVIIAKDLSVEEKTALITILKSHKRAIAWKLSDIKGINPEFCTHKILMEEDFKPAVQHQRRVNPKIHDVINQEVIKLLEAGLINPISDSPWVSPVHCVPKKGRFTVFENEDNELIPTRLVTGWRVYIDYRKLNEATRKEHFLLPFMDQMLERLAGNQYYCFLDGFSSYFQIPIDPKDQEKTTFTCLYGTFAYRRMPFGLCNAPGTFQRCMMEIFHDMIEKTMKVFMDDFSVFGNSFQSCLSHLDHMLKRCEDTNLCLNWEKSHFMVKEENLAADHLSRLENPLQNVLDPKEINESFPLETLNMVSTRGNQSTLWFLDFTNYHAGNFIVKGMSSQQKSKFFKDKPLIYSRLVTLDQPEVTMDLITQPERGIDFMGPFPSSRGNKYILAAVDYLSKWVEAKALPTNDSRVVCKFLKDLFARFGAPRSIISDRGTHFYNDQFTKVMQKYGVTHRLANPYHPQTSDQVEVSNPSLKRILERAVGENRASWSNKLDDAVWALSTGYKTPIGCTPYKLVYGKACHLPVELEYKAYWALKHAKFDLKTAGDHRKVQINELNELRDQAYENSLIYKEK
nr:reverse transcriptase domain-containing protein [Tanacetum cinerariifolium]